MRVAEYHNEKIDVGNIQHSRKQMPELVEALASAADKAINTHLSTVLPSTGFPPHCCLTFDKSTPHRESNQAIVLISNDRGHREAYFVDAPLVYSKEKGEKELSGGQSISLSAQVKTALENVFPSVKITSCVGAVADGQYQSNKFITAFKSDFFPEPDMLNFIQWDPSHCLDLVMKKMMNAEFLKRVGERSALFHRKLGLGKMHSICQGSDEKVLFTKSLSTTRFITSTIHSFLSIVKSYKVYINTMYDYGGMKKNTEDCYEPDEPMVAGYDYILDLLFVVDITKPILSLMTTLQGLQTPCWKVVPLFEEVLTNLQQMRIDVEKQSPEGPWTLTSDLFPLIHKHSSEIIVNKVYQSVPLVEGWLVTKAQNKVEWQVRDISDVHTDVVTFISNILEELEARRDSLIPPQLRLLHNALDISSLIQLAEGRYSSTLKEPITKLIEASNDFIQLFEHVINLQHVKESSIADVPPVEEVFALVIATFK